MILMEDEDSINLIFEGPRLDEIVEVGIKADQLHRSYGGHGMKLSVELEEDAQEDPFKLFVGTPFQTTFDELCLGEELLYKKKEVYAIIKKYIK